MLRTPFKNIQDLLHNTNLMLSIEHNVLHVYYLLDCSNFLEESEIVDIRQPCKMDYSTQPMVLDVADGEVPVMIGLRVFVFEVLIGDDVSVHDSGFP